MAASGAGLPSGEGFSSTPGVGRSLTVRVVAPEEMSPAGQAARQAQQAQQAQAARQARQAQPGQPEPLGRQGKLA